MLDELRSMMKNLYARLRSIMGPAYDLIRDANIERQDIEFNRRILKMMEELGELSEAYLNASSKHNYKSKTYKDVREELADLMLMVVDMCATRMPGEEHMSNKEFEEMQLALLHKKIEKWNTIKHKIK